MAESPLEPDGLSCSALPSSAGDGRDPYCDSVDASSSEGAALKRPFVEAAGLLRGPRTPEDVGNLDGD